MFKRNYSISETGYLLIPNGGHTLLVDTGAPRSFGRGLSGVPGVPDDPPVSLPEGLTIDWLVEQIHHPFHGLVGAEILRERTLVIDPGEKMVEFKTAIIDQHAGVPIRDMMNVPIFSGSVAGTIYEIIFDTGAPLGFVPNDVVTHHEPVDRIAEFYPMMGSFETYVYELPLKIGDKETTLRFGVFPDSVEQMHAQANVPVLVGLGLLDNYRVSLGLRERRLLLEDFK